MGRKVSAIFFVGLWIAYISFSSLYQLEFINFELVAPPAWYVCTKKPTDQVCIDYCALPENEKDPACKPKDQEEEEQEAEGDNSTNDNTNEPNDDPEQVTPESTDGNGDEAGQND